MRSMTNSQFPSQKVVVNIWWQIELLCHRLLESCSRPIPESKVAGILNDEFPPTLHFGVILCPNPFHFEGEEGLIWILAGLATSLPEILCAILTEAVQFSEFRIAAFLHGPDGASFGVDK